MAEFKKVTGPIVGAVFVAFLGICLFSIQWANAAIIQGIRTGSDQAYVRVVIETNTPLVPIPKVSVNRNTLQISLTGIENDASALKSEAFRDDVVNIHVIRTSTETRIDTVLAFTPTNLKTFFLINPHRFVIDAYRPASNPKDGSVDENLQPISTSEEVDMRLNQKGNPLSPTQKEKLRKLPEAFAIQPSGDFNADGSKPKRFQQRLLIFLIVVTSIILVVIIFLMCMDKEGKQHRNVFKSLKKEERSGRG